MTIKVKPNVVGWILGVMFAGFGVMFLSLPLWAAGSVKRDEDVLTMVLAVLMGVYMLWQGLDILVPHITLTESSLTVIPFLGLPAVVDLSELRSFSYDEYAPMGASDRHKVRRIITFYTDKRTIRIRYPFKTRSGDWELIKYLSDHYPQGAC